MSSLKTKHLGSFVSAAEPVLTDTVRVFVHMHSTVTLFNTYRSVKIHQSEDMPAEGSCFCLKVSLVVNLGDGVPGKGQGSQAWEERDPRGSEQLPFPVGTEVFQSHCVHVSRLTASCYRVISQLRILTLEMCQPQVYFLGLTAFNCRD